MQAIILAAGMGKRLKELDKYGLQDYLKIKQKYFDSYQKSLESTSEGKKPLGRVITRKPILPSKEELEENPRSRSAKLRVLEGVSQD